MIASSDRVVDLIRSKIRANQRRATLQKSCHFTPLQLPNTTVTIVSDRGNSPYTLGEMLSLYDRQFIQGAYLVLLKRDPDTDGMNDRLRRLREGSLSRVELLFRLRFGPEGKISAVKVKGLFKAFIIDRLSRIPILGYGVRFFRALLYLPYLQQDTEELRGLIAMLKNDSDGKIETIVEFQNTQFSKLSRISSDKEIQ